MALLNRLIYKASDYKIFISSGGSVGLPGKTLPLLTVETFDYDIKKEDEVIYAIGDEEPIGIKTTASSYEGKFSVQAGELASFLVANGFTNVTELTGGVIGISTFDGLFGRFFMNISLTSEGFSLKAKDKQSLVNIDWKAQKMKGI
jgi:hypothetical protein